MIEKITWEYLSQNERNEHKVLLKYIIEKQFIRKFIFKTTFKKVCSKFKPKAKPKQINKEKHLNYIRVVFVFTVNQTESYTKINEQNYRLEDKWKDFLRSNKKISRKWANFSKDQLFSF